MRLRSVGLSRTHTRMAVLRHMAADSRPITHAELALSLGDGFDRVSVYRALKDLTRVGMLTRADNGDHVWRFSLSLSERSHRLDHPHFVCVRCGAVTCLSKSSIRIARGAAPLALHARRVEVQLRGECDSCARPLPSRPSPSAPDQNSTEVSR